MQATEDEIAANLRRLSSLEDSITELTRIECERQLKVDTLDNQLTSTSLALKVLPVLNLAPSYSVKSKKCEAELVSNDTMQPVILQNDFAVGKLLRTPRQRLKVPETDFDRRSRSREGNLPAIF